MQPLHDVLGESGGICSTGMLGPGAAGAAGGAAAAAAAGGAASMRGGALGQAGLRSPGEQSAGF